MQTGQGFSSVRPTSERDDTFLSPRQLTLREITWQMETPSLYYLLWMRQEEVPVIDWNQGVD